MIKIKYNQEDKLLDSKIMSVFKYIMIFLSIAVIALIALNDLDY
jgi:hypothetical protein